MRKTRVKKQTRKNKTKRRAIRGGMPWPPKVYGNPYPGAERCGNSYSNGRVAYARAQSENTEQSTAASGNAAQSTAQPVNTAASKNAAAGMKTRSMTKK